MPTTVQLPAGVSRRPGKPAGIAVGADDRSLVADAAAGYAAPVELTPDQFLAAVRRSPDYAPLLEGATAQPRGPAVVCTAAHRGAPPKPDVWVLQDLPLSNGRVLNGTTLGQTIADKSDNAKVQAVIEFHGFGMAVLDFPDEDNVELWVSEPGGKVAVGRGPCHVTVYNLDEVRSPLTALAAYNPGRTTSSGKLATTLGPILAVHYVPEKEFVITFNAAYINRPPGEAGGRLVGPPPTDAERTIRIPLGAQVEVGPHVYNLLYTDPAIIRAFVRLNVRVLPAPGGVELGPGPGEKYDLRDRANLAAQLAPGRPLHRRMYEG
jgi:hypothetical protein